MTDRATTSVTDAAVMIGISRTLAFEEIRQTGQLVGVPVLRVGRRRLLIPTAPLRAALGLDEESDDGPE